MPGPSVGKFLLIASVPYRRFIELAKLIEPGQEPKTDKPSILADAIKHVQQMAVENHQLKMLNKFLEVRLTCMQSISMCPSCTVRRHGIACVHFYMFRSPVH